MKITNKQEFLEASMGLRLGNRVRNWASFDELLAETNKPETVSIRHKIPGSKLTKFGTNTKDALSYVNILDTLGVAKRNDFFFNENPDDSRILVQGEVMRSKDGLYLLYSFAKKPMRLALAEQSLHAERTKARIILEYFLDGNSLDDLYTLLDLYEDHIIEFGAYDYNLGVLTNRNTIIWEVRCY